MTQLRALGLTLACTLSIAACAPTPGAPTPTTPSDSAAPATTAPSSDATLEPTTVPSTEPSSGASTSPSEAPLASAPAPDPSLRVILSGSIYDAAGATVSGATVRLRSMDASVPYDATATSVAGSYVFNDVPQGANMEAIATRDGWTSRRRVASFQGATGERNTLDFGASSRNATNSGAAYFIAKYPEIVRTEPTLDAKNVDATKLVYKLVLSEPLNEENRDRFEAAIRVLPANAAAYGDQAGTVDLSDREDQSFPLSVVIDGNSAVAPYTIKRNSTFLSDSASKARVSWNADGTEATLTFPAALSTRKNDGGAYQVLLVSDGPSERIRDSEGNQLGTDENGRLGTYPARGNWILSTFMDTELRISSLTGLTAGSVENRWASTHDNVATFEVRRDTTEPTLSGVSATTLNNDTRIELTFSEPMAAFDGTNTGIRHPGLANLDNYAFMLGRRAADIDDEKLKGNVALRIDPTATAHYGVSDAERKREFRFDTNAFVTTRAGAPTGSIAVEVDGKDPTHVFLYIVGRPGFFDNSSRGIRVRTENLGDPAGNSIKDRQADANQPVGSI